MCEDIWFDDGNIVLHVDKTIFRVHRSILAKHSSILRSMLSLPQPDNDQGKALPVIPLYDSAADAKELLMVLYNPFYFSNARHSFGFLSGISRLSTKYDIPSLRGEAINQLKCIFPTTFNAFEFMPSREAVESLAIRAVNLARETDCWEILPCAFYYCSRLPIPNIVRGTSGARLSRNDVDVCIIGRDLLLKKQRKVSHPFLYAPPPGLPKPSPNGRPGGCSAPATCVEGGNPGAVLKYLNGLDMLTPMALEIFTDWQKIGRCGACGDKQAAVHWIAVEKVWEELPQIFGLGTWESIEKRGD
ncbi:hypothetical protein BV22DRAFT_1004316 [Leucogyrophana mollusca]|uniref:Uncharacterized protein n=1 Tax=Leucogyrophana mollusca TaxID=85980 RepID=A0ACB8BV63_9AGAM|nr:hypothetical protein BV22DRAFT_1004316 [Leucogyrophana mollusca]